MAISRIKRAGRTAGIVLATLAAPALLAALIYLLATAISTNSRVTRLEQASPCALRQTVRCRQSIEGILALLTPAQRAHLASELFAYLPARNGRVIIERTAHATRAAPRTARWSSPVWGLGPGNVPGERGAAGAHGANGTPGQTGPPGPRGRRGPPGPPGPRGAHGPRGQRGRAGANGTVTTIVKQIPPDIQTVVRAVCAVLPVPCR